LYTLFTHYYFICTSELDASILMPSVLITALLTPKAINVIMRSINPGSAQRPIPYVVFQMLAAMCRISGKQVGRRGTSLSIQWDDLGYEIL